MKIKNLRNLRIGAKLGLLVSIALTIIVLLTSIIAFFNLNYSINEAKKRELSDKIQIFNQSLTEQYTKAVMLSSAIASMPDVQEAFYKQDRKLLATITYPVFKKLKKEYSIRQFQFHTPPATSFLRLHKLKKYGDDLSGFRKTVVTANQKKIEIAGLEVGVAGLGVRGVTPVFYQGQHIGTVEFGLNFGQSFFNNFKEQNKTDVALFINRKDGPELFASTLPESFGLNAAMLEKINNSKDGLDLKYNKKYYTVVSFPVFDYSKNVLGKAVLAIDVSSYNNLIHLSLIINAISLLVASIIAFFFVHTVNKTISSPITTISERMKALVENDITSEIPYLDRTDEIGEIANAVGIFRNNEEKKEKLEKETKEKQSLEQRKAKKVNAAVENFQARIDEVLNHLNDATNIMQDDSVNSQNSVKDTLNQSTEALTSANHASSNVQTVASAVTELTASIQEIAKNVNDTAKSVKECNAYATSSAESLNTLQNRISTIDEVIESINSVAEQTNLLALNATIEAARAGDAGKGFAVVASEVKSLANQTANMTEEISRIVKDIKDSSAITITTVQNIIEQMHNIDSQTSDVASSVEQQSEATQEIDKSANQAATDTRNITEKLDDIKNATDKSKEISDSLANSSEKLAQQTKEIQEAVQIFLSEVTAS